MYKVVNLYTTITILHFIAFWYKLEVCFLNFKKKRKQERKELW